MPFSLKGGTYDRRVYSYGRDYTLHTIGLTSVIGKLQHFLAYIRSNAVKIKIQAHNIKTRLKQD